MASPLGAKATYTVPGEDDNAAGKSAGTLRLQAIRTKNPTVVNGAGAIHGHTIALCAHDTVAGVG